MDPRFDTGYGPLVGSSEPIPCNLKSITDIGLTFSEKNEVSQSDQGSFILVDNGGLQGSRKGIKEENERSTYSCGFINFVILCEADKSQFRPLNTTEAKENSRHWDHDKDLGGKCSNYHVSLVDNLERTLFPSSLRDFIYKHTLFWSQSYI
uniref:Uncharacterized protein n=1 Tax=Solanum lycopersicum TaxID=4081 RepID=A0A3Q7ECT2_SOLLC